MPVESVTHIADLNASNPVGATDPVSDLDNHVRNIKSALKTDFANITGAVTATHTVLNNIGHVLLATGTASASAALDFTTLLDSTYDEYVFELVNLVPATNAAILWIRTSADAGANWASAVSDYMYRGHEPATLGAGVFSDGGLATKIVTQLTGTSSTASHGGVNGTVKLYKPAGSAYKHVTWLLSYQDTATSIVGSSGAGSRPSTSAVTGVRFLMSSGNITSGTINLYGVKK